MKTQRIVAAVAAASLLLSTGGVFGQAERNQELLDQAQRDAQRGYPRGDPRSGDARTPGDARGGRDAGRGAPPASNRVAQPRDNRVDPRAGYRPDNRDQGADTRGSYRGDGRAYDRGDGRAYGRGDGRAYGRNDNGYQSDHWGHDGRGAGPDRSFYRGGRLPNEYRSRQYVVEDWRSHRLYAPPRGYQWVQTGGDYVLVAVATGIIAAILLNQ